MAHAHTLWQMTAPPMWEVSPARASDGAVLRIGRQQVALADIKAYFITNDIERDQSGQLILGAWFIIGAACFTAGVLQFGYMTRFLLGSAFLFALGTVALTEFAFASTFAVQRLTIETHDGRTLSFTSADRADFADLLATIQAAAR